MLSLEKFKEEARLFAKTLKAGDIILLNGPMGAGKTTFVSALATHFNYEDVSSPSFALVNHYATAIPIIHMDLYRCKNENDIIMLDLDHYFEKDDHIVIIEWAQKAPWLEERSNYIITIDVTPKFKRKINIKQCS